ncbi:MAG: S41 family peptidase [Lachnospiraceae bacterium]|nr:S41 family peptidase [Lachnospiraceae bacterium]
METETEQDMQQQETEQTQGSSTKNNRGSFMKGVVAGLAAAVIISMAALLLGKYVITNPRANISAAQSNGVKEASVVNSKTMQKMQVLQEAIGSYYMEDTDADTLQEGAYHGMVEALEDPYSTYYSEEELVEVQESSQGIYYGIGAYIGMDTDVGMARISKVMPNSPAEADGVLAGDYIYKVEDEYVKGLTLEEIIAKVKGPEGTKVKLTMLRENETDPVELEVTRKQIESPTVTHKTLDGGISYIQISEFDAVTVDQFTEAMAEEKVSGMNGLIIDLRDNLGGNLSAVNDIARQLLPKGLIVYTEDKYGKREEYTCDGSREIKVPMVVLVNGNSASASEILAGAVKDYKIGTLLGTTTFGKGIVQRIISLSDGSAVKLTVSKYYTPNGNNIHKIGIEPDEELKLDVESYLKNGTDNQLNRAVEIIKEQLKNTK